MSLEADETSHQDLDVRVKAMVERVMERAAFPLCWLAWAKTSLRNPGSSGGELFKSQNFSQ